MLKAPMVSALETIISRTAFNIAFNFNMRRYSTLSSTMFLFFACLAPAIAFGTLFADYTENQLGATVERCRFTPG